MPMNNAQKHKRCQAYLDSNPNFLLKHLGLDQNYEITAIAEYPTQREIDIGNSRKLDLLLLLIDLN